MALGIPWLRAAGWATAIMAVVGGCAAIGEHECPAGSKRMQTEMVYFGTLKPGSAVTDEDWRRFLAETVTPRFPNGLTSWQANGQWRGKSGVIEREHSYVLSIVHAGSPTDEQNLVDVTSAYQRQFNQEAVLRVSQRACARH